MNRPDQELCKRVITYLAPIQQGEVEAKDFLAFTRDEFEKLWDQKEIEELKSGIKLI